MTDRRTLLLGAGLAPVLSPLARPALAQSGWPERTIRIVVPYPPGGSVDVLTRILAERLQNRLGQTIVVENRAGAGGNIGMDAVARSPADGYTWGAATVGHFSIHQYLYARMPWEVDRDFAPLSLTWELPNVAVVPSQHVPATTMAEFLAWARERRGRVSFGSPGVGTTPHLTGALFNARQELGAEHIPFRGAAQTIPAMLSGDVAFAIDNLASYVPVIQEGRMRALAVTSAERWPTLPEVPTMAEAGVPDLVVTSWAAYVVPSNTPGPVVERANVALRAVLEDEEVGRRFLQAGARALSSSPEAVTARGRRERPMWQEAVRISGARAD